MHCACCGACDVTVTTIDDMTIRVECREALCGVVDRKRFDTTLQAAMCAKYERARGVEV